MGTLLFSADTFAWGLRAACELLRIPYAQHLILQQIPPPYTDVSLQQAAQTLGIRNAWRETRADGLQALPLPCMVALSPQQGSEHRLGLVLACNARHVLLAQQDAPEPVRMAHSDFAALFTGRAMLMAAQTSVRPSADAVDMDEAARPRFGFRWFVPELLRHRVIWRDVLLASAAIQVMALATPLFTQVVIDKVIAHRSIHTLIVVGVALLVLMAFSAAMTWVRQYLVLHTGNRIDAVLGSRVFEHLFRLPLRYFERRPTGTLVARVHGVETIREFLSGAAVMLVLDIPFLAVFLVLMLWYSPMLTLLAVAVLAAIAALSIAVTPLIRDRLNRQFLAGARNQAYLTEHVAGMETVKSLQMEPQLASRYGELLAEYLLASFRARQLSNTYNVLAGALEQFMTLLILCAGAWIVMTDGTMTVGMLVAFQMFAARVSGPVLRMVGLWQEFQQASIAVRRLGDVMDVEPEPGAVQPLRETSGAGRIEFRDVGFRYRDDLPYVCRGLSFVIEPGQCVAVMGRSGCGKSTLARLLQGFCRATEGSVRIDGRDVSSLAANELRSRFGVVPQETTLFSGTISDNFMAAHPNATFPQIVEACRMAEIHDFIDGLPDGYGTVIGEHGAGLSGGQKQRIAIARAMLKSPAVLLFDEAASSLDPDTAEQLAATINRLRGRATLVFIAHQLPRGLQVDRVITLSPAAAEPDPVI